MKSKRVGVIGGGQLAWMMAAEAPKLNIELIVQTPNPDDPAVCRAHDLVLADIDDARGTARLAQDCDVITFENEFVDLKALRQVETLGQAAHFYPALSTLAPLLDKYEQRNYLKSIGVRVPEFSLDLTTEQIIANYCFPVVLKARRHGYDGQGTFVVKDAEGLRRLAKTVPIPELLVEEFIPFKKELGVIAARNMSGEMAIYPVTETYQENQVCHWTITPADVSAEVATEVQAIARKILDTLNVVGVFGIEFFLTKDNRVLVNEIAPRTHNSGHYTLDGCDTSQFAMQLQAVTGMSLGSTNLKSAGVIMVNLLGFEGEGRSGHMRTSPLSTLPNHLVEESDLDYQQRRNSILQIPHSFVHWYGKSSRTGRKLGHATVLLDTEQLLQAKSIIQKIESIWYQ